MYPNEECILCAQSQKEWRLLWDSKFVPFEDEIFLRKIMERKAILAKIKHQYCVSRLEEHDCSANNKKNEDY